MGFFPLLHTTRCGIRDLQKICSVGGSLKYIDVVLKIVGVSWIWQIVPFDLSADSSGDPFDMFLSKLKISKFVQRSNLAVFSLLLPSKDLQTVYLENLLCFFCRSGGLSCFMNRVSRPQCDPSSSRSPAWTLWRIPGLVFPGGEGWSMWNMKIRAGYTNAIPCLCFIHTKNTGEHTGWGSIWE